MHTSNTEHDETLKEQIEQAIINYRIKCDMAVSERDDGFYTQKEYEEAITFELDKAMQLILQDRERAVKELAESFHNRIFNNFSMLPRIQSTYTGNRNIDARELQKVMCDSQRDLAQLSNPTQEKKGNYER